MMGLIGIPTLHYQCEEETARERTGYPTSYAEAKNMRSPLVHTYAVCLGNIFWNCSGLALLVLS